MRGRGHWEVGAWCAGTDLVCPHRPPPVPLSSVPSRLLPHLGRDERDGELRTDARESTQNAFTKARARALEREEQTPGHERTIMRL